MEKFKPLFSLPYFLLEYVPKSKPARPQAGQHVQEICLETADCRLKISYADLFPAPVKWENRLYSGVVLGAPIINDQIDKTRALASIAGEEELKFSAVSGINGEFLLFFLNKNNSKLTVINDRFASFPLYYCHEEATRCFYATPYFTHIWQLLKSKNKLDLNQEAFFEFIWLQRILGTKTYLRQVSYLPDASILEIWNGQTKLTRYWQRNYQKSRRPFQVHAAQLADLVRQSIKRKTSDHQRYGHFLSGGMDSRSVLAAFTDNFPVCFTAAIAENRELRTARKIAQTKGATHVALELHPEHFGQIMKHSVQVCGGMYNYDNGLFLGFNEAVKRHADVCFHGHGFDYMFQGMYIPGKSWQLAGRTLYLRTMLTLPEDLTTYFINNASYRTKRADIWKYVRPDQRERLKEFQRQSVAAILAYGRTLTNNANDLFEFLTFHHITRHYSYPNNACIGTFAEQRSISFDNDIFDFYLSLPVAHRFNGKIEKQGLKILDPHLAAIWSANTNLPVTASCWTQTAYQLAGFLKRKISPREDKPAWEERTWTSRDFAVRNQQSIKEALTEVFNSGSLAALAIFDTDRIQKDFSRWVNGEDLPGISGDFVQALLTVGIFLKNN